MSSDSDIVGDVVVGLDSGSDDVVGHEPVAPMPPIGQPLGARPLPRVRGPPRIFLLVSVVGGLWDGLYDVAPPTPSFIPAVGGLVVGVALSRWTFSHTTDSAGDELIMRDLLKRQSRCRECLGFLEYPIFELAKLDEPIAVLDDLSAVQFCHDHAEAPITFADS